MPAAAVQIGQDFEPDPTPAPPPPIGADFEPDGLVRESTHRLMNDVRSFGAAAGKYIFHGLQGLSEEQARILANPEQVPELYQATGDQTLLPPEEQARMQQERIDSLKAQVPNAQSTAAYWKLRADQADTQSDVDPHLAQTWDARISRATGSATVMGMEGTIPGIGLPIMAMHGALSTESEALDAGKSYHEATDAAARSLIGLAVFGAGSKVAALTVAKLLPNFVSNPGALTKFVAQFAGQETANELSSRAINAYEMASQAAPGNRVAAAIQGLTQTNLETETLNAVYAGMGAAHEVGGSAHGRAPEKIGQDFEPDGSVGLSDVKVPVPPTPPAEPSAVAPEPPPPPLPTPAVPAWQVTPEARATEFDRLNQNLAGLNQPPVEQLTAEPPPPNNPPHVIASRDRQGNIRLIEYRQNSEGQYVTNQDLTDLPLYEKMGSHPFQAAVSRSAKLIDELNGSAPAPAAPSSPPVEITPETRRRATAETKAAQAAAEHRAELLGQLSGPQSGQGKELLEAIIDAGGLPAKSATSRAPWKGELERLDDFIRKNPNRKEKIQPNRFLRANAPDVDRLVTSLRDQGFNIDTPQELFPILEDRLMSGKPMYGTPAAEDFRGGLRAAEAPEQYGKLQWPANFPDVTIHTNIQRLRSSPEYKAAKAGDPAAAAAVVSRLVKPERIRELAAKHPDAIVAAVHSEEQAGRNQIPLAYALRFGHDGGLEVETSIVQKNRTFHTNAGAAHRLFTRPEFDGPVESGRPYIIVDDVTTSGSTLNELRKYIERNGGKVVAASTLATTSGPMGYGGHLAPRSGILDNLKRKFGARPLDDLLSNYGFQTDELTNSQARYLAGFKSIDSIRDRLAQTGQTTERPGNSDLLPAAKQADAQQIKAATAEQLRLFEQAATDYVDQAGVRPENKQEAIDGITRTLSFASDPRLARAYEGPQGELFDDRGAGLAAEPTQATDTGATANRRTSRVGAAHQRGLNALAAGDAGTLNQVLAQTGNRVSTILHELFTGQRTQWNVRGSVIASPADMMMAVQVLRSPFQESLKVAVIDRSNRVLHSEVVTIGTLNESIAHPREIFHSAAIQKDLGRDVRIIVSHNHPSGDPTPSSTDMRLQRRLEQVGELLGIPVADHVITNGKQYYSFQHGAGELPVRQVAPWELRSADKMPRISDPSTMAQYVAALRSGDPSSAHILYVGTKYDLKAVERFPFAANVKLFQKTLLEGISREGAYAVLLDLPTESRRFAGLPDRERLDPPGMLRRLQDALEIYGGIKILDATWEGMDSAQSHGILEEPGQYKTPKLQPGQKQGDLLAGTDQDVFNLAGQEGIDYQARAEAAQRAELERNRAQQEADRDQLRLMETPTQDDFESAANDREKMRQHIETVQRMTDVSPDVKQRVESWYTPISLKEVQDRASATVDQLGLGKATDRFMTARKIDANTLALGHHVALRLDQLGRFDEAATIRDAMAERLTSPAQALWFISTIAKTSPEGLIRQAQKVVTDQIRMDPDKMALMDEINRLKAQLAQFPEGKGKTAATEIVIRNLAKVNKPGQRLTPAQLQDLLIRNKAGKLTEEDLAAALAKRMGLPRLTPENIARIRAAQAAWAATSDPIMKLRRGAEMMDSVYGLVPHSFWDKVRAAAVISMILHGRLPIRIGASNILQMGGQMVVDAFNAFTLDPAVSVLTGRRTVKGPELRDRLAGLAAPAEAFRAGYVDAQARKLGTWPSFKEGVRTLLDMATMTTRGIQEINEINGRTMHTFSSRFGRLAEDTVTLLHNVVPYAFWNAAYRASLTRQMRIAGASVPTAEMLENGRLDANKAIFQNETAAYHMMRGIRRVLDYPTAKITGGKYGFGTATVPFAKVPGAILTEGATWTPLGFVRAGWEAFRPIFTKEPFRQKDFVDAFTKAAAGTGSLVATGYWLAKLGVITGPPEDNKDLEAMRRSAGMGAYRVNVSELKRRFLAGNFTTRMGVPYGQDGDLTISYNWLEPIAFPLGMGADIAHSQDKREIDLKRGKITSNAAVAAMTAGLQSLTTHPMMQGTEKFLTTFAEQGPGPAGLGVVTNVPGNFVPSLVRQTSQLIDNAVREGRGGSLIDQEVARLQQQIPWLSQRFPARYDVFGDAIQRYNYANNSLLNVFFNPAQPNELRKNPSVNELMRLWEQTSDSRALPNQAARGIAINGKQIQLDNVQLATYQRYIGRLSSAGIARLLASPQFAAEPPAIKTSAITQVLNAVNEAAKIDLFGQKPYTIGNRGSVRIAAPAAFAELYQGRSMGLNAAAPIGQ